jgi:hypothetical protein
MSSTKIAYFVSIRYQTWPLQTILVSDWLISKRSSPLKSFCQMNRNLVGNIDGRSAIKIAQLIWQSGFRGEDLKKWPIRNKNCLWCPCLLMDRDKMSNLYRGPSIDAGELKVKDIF